MLQIASDIGKVASATAQGRDDDAEAAMAAARLKRAIPGGFIPMSDALRDVEKVLEASKQGVKPTVIQALTGQTPKSPSPNLFGPPAAGGPAQTPAPTSGARTRLRLMLERIQRRKQDQK